MEQDPAFSKGQAPSPPEEVSGAFVPSAEQEPHITTPGELEPNYSPEARLAGEAEPSDAERAVRPDLQPDGPTIRREAPAAPVSQEQPETFLELLEKVPGKYTEIAEPETPQAKNYLEAILRAQLPLISTRQRLNPYGTRTDISPEKTYIGVLTTSSEQLTELVTMENRPVKAEDIPLSKEGYELLAFHLNRGKIPTFNELVKLRELATANDPRNLLEDPELTEEERAALQGHIKDVQEKTLPEFWMLSDEESSWYSRVAEAPSLKPYTPPPPTKKQKGKQKEYKEYVLVNNKYMTKIVTTRRHNNPFAPALPAPEGKKFLSPDEIERVKKDFWDNNPRQEFSPLKRVRLDSEKAILLAAQTEARARLRLDNMLTKLKGEVEAERILASEATKRAVVAEHLGGLGVRHEQQQRVFEEAEEYIKDYNERLTDRSANEAVRIAGAKPIFKESVAADVVTEQLNPPAKKTKTPFQKIKKTSN